MDKHLRALLASSIEPHQEAGRSKRGRRPGIRSNLQRRINMTLTLPGIESLSLSVNEEIRVRASLDRTFKALLEQLGPHNETPDGTSMPMKLESWAWRFMEIGRAHV